MTGMSRTRTRSLIGLAALGLLALVGTGCASGEAAAPTSTPTEGAGTDAVATEVVGLWGEDAEGQPHLEFTADGEVHGTDGCNGIVTTYTVDDGRISLAPFASTLKACAGVDDWLRGVRTAEIDGDVLVAMTATGTKLGELTRTN